PHLLFFLVCSSSLFTTPAPTALYSLSLHDALPIYHEKREGARHPRRRRARRRSRDREPAPLQGRRHRGQDRLRGRYRSGQVQRQDRKSTRLNSSHVKISYAVFCLKKKKKHVLRQYI